MAYEVINTSAPAGVVPGQTGYCDVLRTQGVPEPVCSELAKMSHYEPDLCGDGESVAVRTLRFGGETWGVVSRTVPCGVDHTGRMNRLAHHVIVPPSELASTDPVAVLRGFAFRSAYDASPRMADSLPTWSGASTPSGAWRGADLTDWDRHVTDLTAAGRKQLVLLPVGVPLQAMVAEVLAGLPQGERWRVGVVSGVDASTAWNQGARLRFLVGTPNRSGAAWQAWPGEEAIDLRIRPAAPARAEKPARRSPEPKPSSSRQGANDADRLVDLSTPKPGAAPGKPRPPGPIDIDIDPVTGSRGTPPIDIGIIDPVAPVGADSGRPLHTDAVRWGIVAMWALMGLLAGALVGTILWQVSRR